jgi:hypothetical protein
MSLRRKKATTYSVCGTLLSPGESVNVLEEQIGEWERKLATAGKLVIRKTSQPGVVQVLRKA